MSRLRSVLSALLFSLSLTAGGAQAVQLTYRAVDLAASDFWRYDYTLSGTFAEFEGVTLLYAPANYETLSILMAPGLDAFVSFLGQPDPVLDADGVLALTAVRDVGATESFSFSVRFHWLGAGVPGAQPFELFDSTFQKVGGGQTTQPPVPEPGTLVLMLVGLAALLARGLRRAPPGTAVA